MNIIPVSYPAPEDDMTPRQLCDISDLIVHHTAGPTIQRPLEIDAFERTRGYAMLPYEYMIDAAGLVYAGRPLQFVSAASLGRNAQSVAVCCIGNFEKDDAGFTGAPTSLMVAALTDLAVYLHQKLPISRTFGHGDVARLFYPDDEESYATLCPGSELSALIPQLKRDILTRIGH